MSSNKNNNKNTNLGTWILILILMFAVPPIGWILLFVKLGIIGYRKGKNNSSSNNNSENIIDRTINSIKGDEGNIKGNRKLDKKTGKGLSILLLLVSMCFFISGASMTIGELTSLIAGNPLSVTGLGFGIFWLLSGLVTFLSRNIVAHRFIRYKSYFAFIGGRGVVPISDMAQMAGKSPKVVKRDIQAMISSGYLNSSSYIDNELDSLVLSAKDAEKLRSELRMDSFDDLNNQDSLADGTYAASLAELREAKSFINDEGIQGKVLKLEELTEKIFKIVEDHPEKQPQLRRFMSYYFPTTLKLVRSYATLEKQGVKGENILSTKKSIGDVLDTLTTGYEQQLDQLFKSDAIDIAADISVLEKLMQQDGLADDKAGFQVAVSGS